MYIYKCTLDDTRQLAILNKKLIEDEKHDNPMNTDELAKRMQEFISGDYNAYFYKADNNVIGYALVRISSTPKYLRQFFICREYRRKGCGKSFFTELMKELGEKALDIEVLSWNKTGIKFWESMGFLPRSIYMRYHEN
ncbi:GNAT family N-acetyltransferase [Desulfosporosinus sp. PR]|uniref:GNAT family N-acetyltransferase n=1 Tax=Candidatus Desulfosporosinus nitrosoreducens TaxID=3401928 RepID=UPI0027FD0FD9|nr:GNAT family N-acetyltransferase [Desulfosporosinus sp. PR]MDQ7096646.1 GNAT family N-acetyltransferase [Desulfosporosinus sp. PR]